MNVKILSCRIFEDYINQLMQSTKASFDYDIEFFEIDQHNHPDDFNKILQKRINEITGYDLIFLLYGICGNVTKDIYSKQIPIAIPRVHDCATILLGGKSRYMEVFGHRPSQGWNCISYDSNKSHSGEFFTNSNYQQLLEKYGEDNAKYLYEMLYPQSENLIYIDFGFEKDKKKIQENKLITEVVKGDYTYLINVFSKNFEDILIIQPGEKIYPVYDMDQVITKKLRC